MEDEEKTKYHLATRWKQKEQVCVYVSVNYMVLHFTWIF